MKHYYFGCYKDKGHYWFTSDEDGNIRYEFENELKLLDIDKTFCPIFTNEEGIANRWILDNGKNKRTILSFWDYSIDNRPGSNSNFIFEGEHSFDEMMLLMNEHFPSIMERFKFKIEMREL